MNHGSAGIAQGEILAVGFEGEIGVQLGTRDTAVLAGSEYNDARAGRNRCGGKQPLLGKERIIAQGIACKVEPCIVFYRVIDLDPVRGITVFIKNR